MHLTVGGTKGGGHEKPIVKQWIPDPVKKSGRPQKLIRNDEHSRVGDHRITV